MAEGGGEERDGNPFSFKKFVKKKDNSRESDESDSSDNQEKPVLDLPDISAGQGRERRHHGEDHHGRKSRKDDDNPFSFKKFLQSGSSSCARTSEGIANLDLANDLPDFVQDHYPSASNSDSSRRPRHVHIPDAPLPDFALDSESGMQTSPSAERRAQLANPELLPEVNNEPLGVDNLNLANANLGSGARPRINNVNLLNDVEPRVSASDEGDSDSDSIEALPQPNNASGQLPDFLSDNVIRPVTCGAGPRPVVGRPAENGINGVDLHSHSPDFLAGPGESEIEMTRLREENRTLMEQLNEAREFSERESQRVAGVLQEMESIQKREAEETSALENMVQQVEANLETTTKRAVEAESTIKKLQHEIKALKVQNQTLGNENTLLRGGQNLTDPVREKAKYASEQLATAANNAEQQLKHMLKGVDQLRLMSNILASVDKLSDVSPEPDSGAAGSSHTESPSPNSNQGAGGSPS